jgi:hypothetical protein
MMVYINYKNNNYIMDDKYNINQFMDDQMFIYYLRKRSKNERHRKQLEEVVQFHLEMEKLRIQQKNKNNIKK